MPFEGATADVHLQVAVLDPSATSRSFQIISAAPEQGILLGMKFSQITKPSNNQSLLEVQVSFHSEWQWHTSLAIEKRLTPK